MGSYSIKLAQVSSFLPMADHGDVIDRAAAILVLLSKAYQADQTAGRLAATAKKPDDAPDWAGLNPRLFSDALDGVTTLLALSRHLELAGDGDVHAS